MLLPKMIFVRIKSIDIWSSSSVGRALRSHRIGRWFESNLDHHVS